MADERQEQRNQQSGSGSHSGQGPSQGNRDTTHQQHDQNPKNQSGQQIPKKEPQGSEREKGTEKSGTR